MKILSILIAVVLFSSSCKNQEAQVYEFSQEFNKEEKEIKHANLKQAKAFYINKKTVNLDFIINTKAEYPEDLDKKEFSVILDQALKENPKGKDLVNEGVKLQVRVYNGFGIKVFEFPLKEYSTNDIK